MNSDKKGRFDSVDCVYEISSKFTKQGNKTQAPKPSEIQRIIKETTKDITKKDGE